MFVLDCGDSSLKSGLFRRCADVGAGSVESLPTRERTYAAVAVAFLRNLPRNIDSAFSSSSSFKALAAPA